MKKTILSFIVARVFVAISFLIVACSPDVVVEDASKINHELCEEAARHQESCTGEYITPPVCDGPTALAAERILSTDCEDFANTFNDDVKADGAFCDWFGVGCTPDENIFWGPACQSDADCSLDSFCVEGSCFYGVASHQFGEVLDYYTDSTEVGGNHTELLVDNHATRLLRRQMIENAEHTVHFTALFIEEGEAADETIELFAEAVARGVDVRVAVDATSQYMFASYPLIEEMAARGVQVLPFNAIVEWAGIRVGATGITANNRLHEKILVVDGQEAIVGGRNVGDVYLLPNRWRDLDVYVSGPGVSEIQRMFLNIWDRNNVWERQANCINRTRFGFYCPRSGNTYSDDLDHYPSLEVQGESYTRAIYSDPIFQDTSNGYFTTIALVRGARHSITISNSYFVPPSRLRKHLRAAAARGVEVNVLTNSKESTDAWWMYYASLNYYKELVDAGINIYQFNGTETMHSKAMLVDDELALVGSFNLDPRSAIDNSEALVLIRQSEVIDHLRDSIAKDIQNSTPATSNTPFTEMLKARSMRIAEPML